MDGTAAGAVRAPAARRRSTVRRLMRRRSMIAFLFTLPLIVIIVGMVLYPALYSIHLATLNKPMERFVGLGNFEFLVRRGTFSLVVKQAVGFAVVPVLFKALVGS